MSLEQYFPLYKFSMFCPVYQFMPYFVEIFSRDINNFDALASLGEIGHCGHLFLDSLCVCGGGMKFVFL